MPSDDQPTPESGPRQHYMHIDIDLNGIGGRIANDLKRRILYVAAGLYNIDHVDPETLELPINIKIQINQDHPISKEEAVDGYREWILSNGFRDVIECISGALEPAHNVLSLWELTSFASHHAAFPVSEWQRVVTKGEKDFHQYGFPTKIEHITDHHGVKLDPQKVAYVLSINKARNCLVHRGGIVGQKDVRSGGVLKVSWLTISLTLQTESGEVPVKVGQTIKEGGTLTLKISDAEKVFSLGEQVKFTAEEFAEICWTLVAFGMHVGDKISELGASKGALCPPEQPTSGFPAEMTVELIDQGAESERPKPAP